MHENNSRATTMPQAMYLNNQSQSLPAHYNSDINSSSQPHIPRVLPPPIVPEKPIPQANSSRNPLENSSPSLQSFSQNQTLAGQKVKIESESRSPILVEDQMMNNEEYILEPSAVEEQTLDEVLTL